jgi:DNA-directed RNA polymerase subunit RPC12/RpoP
LNPNFKFNIDSIEDDEDLILINKEEIKDLKCARCGSPLIVRVYSKGTKLHRKISCDNCKTKVWK